MKPEEHYEYRFEDRSILLRLLHSVLFMPVVRALPRSITPNQVTVAGHLGAGAGFLVVLLDQPIGRWGLLGLAAACLFYTLADCIDGMFARHTQQTSKLGELLDHWLDAATVPLVVLSLALAMPVPRWLALTAGLVTALLHYTTLLHGYRVGFVHLGAIGIIEGTCIGSAACIVTALFGPAPLEARLWGEVSLAAVIVGSVLAGACTSLYSMRKLARWPADFGTIVVALAAVAAWYAWGELSAAVAGGLAIAVSSLLEGGAIRARLVRVPLVRFDALLLLLVVGGASASLAFRLGAGAQTALAALAIAYAAVRGAVNFSRTVAALLQPAPSARAEAPAAAGVE